MDSKRRLSLIELAFEQLQAWDAFDTRTNAIFLDLKSYPGCVWLCEIDSTSEACKSCHQNQFACFPKSGDGAREEESKHF